MRAMVARRFPDFVARNLARAIDAEAGDSRLRARLTSITAALGGRVVHDVSLAGERVDHVVVLTTGVFCVRVVDGSGPAGLGDRPTETEVEERIVAETRRLARRPVPVTVLTRTDGPAADEPEQLANVLLGRPPYGHPIVLSPAEVAEVAVRIRIGPLHRTGRLVPPRPAPSPAHADPTTASRPAPSPPLDRA
jgi:hypothetical protein